MENIKMRVLKMLLLPSLFASLSLMPAWAQNVECNFEQGPTTNSITIKAFKKNTAKSIMTRSSKNALSFALPIYPARMIATRGEVFLLERAGQVLTVPRRLSAFDKLEKGDVIETHSRAFASLRFGDGTENVLPSNSKIQLQEASKGFARVTLLNGSIESRVIRVPNAKKNTFEIQMPAVTVGVRGTHFKINTNNQKQWLSVETGLVYVQKRHTCELPMLVSAGHGVELNQAVTTVRNLIDAPQWLSLNQAQRDKNRLVFNVAPVSGAVRYRAQVANDERFLDIQQEIITQSTELIFSDDGLPNGFYYVRFSAIGADGIEGKTNEHLFLRSRESS